MRNPPEGIQPVPAPGTTAIGFRCSNELYRAGYVLAEQNPGRLATGQGPGLLPGVVLCRQSVSQEIRPSFPERAFTKAFSSAFK